MTEEPPYPVTIAFPRFPLLRVTELALFISQMPKASRIVSALDPFREPTLASKEPYNKKVLPLGSI